MQPCAPGTANSPLGDFTPGSEYNRFDFCTINLVAMGNYVNMEFLTDSERERKAAYMNEKVKNYFKHHLKEESVY